MAANEDNVLRVELIVELLHEGVDVHLSHTIIAWVPLEPFLNHVM